MLHTHIQEYQKEIDTRASVGLNPLFIYISDILTQINSIRASKASTACPLKDFLTVPLFTSSLYSGKHHFWFGRGFTLDSLLQLQKYLCLLIIELDWKYFTC